MFFSSCQALACELEREGVWNDPGKFTNTDETRTVAFPRTKSPYLANTDKTPHENSPDDANDEATLQFLPIYHLVNGRYDRIPQAALHHLRNGLKHALDTHRTVFILINMGLHYVDNPVAGFAKDDYYQQMTTVRTTFTFYFNSFIMFIKSF